jgi:transcriptional regulator with XRE-family HTH domain
MSAIGASGFDDLLRRFRVAAALSQEALAERAGLSLRGVSDLERGARTAPRLETVRMLADALGLAGAERVALLAAAGGAAPDKSPPPDAAPPASPCPQRRWSAASASWRPWSSCWAGRTPGSSP